MNKKWGKLKRFLSRQWRQDSILNSVLETWDTLVKTSVCGNSDMFKGDIQIIVSYHCKPINDNLIFS